VNWGDSGYGYVNAAAPQTTYQQGQSTQTFTHAYTYAGTYTVTFTVSGQNGQSNTSSATVTVSANGSGTQTLTVTPQYGNAPLYSTFTMYFPGCNGGNYYLYYGDGTSDFVAVPADLCNSTATRYHTYTTNGSFTASLRNSNQSTTYATTIVTVGNGGSSNTLTATPSYGTKPLTVMFSGNPGGVAYSGGVVIVFGDGSAGTFCTPNESCNQRTTSHIYTNAGTYYATLQGSNYGSTQNLGSATITVNN
jgi:PKD repeat protein